jgi:hypothetical protein
MTLEQCVDLPVRDEYDLFPEEVLETEAEKAAYTQYVLAKLAESEKKIAEGKAVWISNEEVFARIDALIEAWESQ